MKIKIAILLIGMIFSCSLFAETVVKPRPCSDYHIFSELKHSLKNLDAKFDWNNPHCKTVATRSVFPRKNQNGKVNFEKGLQLFIYENDKLKFICLPGWICKSWE